LGIPPSARASIETMCRAAETLHDERKLRLRIVADLSNETFPKASDGRGSWRSFATMTELDTYVKEQASPHTRARIWSAPDGTTIAEVHFESDTEDSAVEVDYCFRRDGSLARADATLSSFVASSPVRRVTYFGQDGRALPGRPGEHTISSGDEVPIYPNVLSLPFLAPRPISARDIASLLPPAARDRDRSRIIHFISTHAWALKQCYERALAKHPVLAGTLKARWTVDTAGVARDFAWQHDDLGDAQVKRCIEDVFAAWHFDPPPATPIEVSFPFVFRIADPPPHDRRTP
jgi:hypothetical protein